MFTGAPKRGFTFVELLAVITIVGVLVALLLPAISLVREASRRISCSSKMQQFGIGLLAYADIHEAFPPSTSTNVAFAPAGSAKPAATTSPEDTTMAGFSWIVMILPFMGEQHAYDLISQRSHRFDHSVAPFDLTMTESGNPILPATQATDRHLATLDFNFVHCSSFSGEPYSTDQVGQPDNYRAGMVAPTSGHLLDRPIGLFLTNYVALSATHLNCMARSPSPLPLAEPPNGIMIPTHGTKLAGIVDGQSKTFLLCETREQGYSSWYDGSTAWTVGVLSTTGDYHLPDTGLQAAEKSFDPVNNPLTLWHSSPVGADPSRVALNFGEPQHYANSVEFFLAHPGTDAAHIAAASDVTLNNPWKFGPSSEHRGIVQHLVADGAVRIISQEVDATVYMRLITRAGKEQDPIPFD